MSTLCTLAFVEIENFKSYRNFHRLGPLSKFSAVIGPNGSGKSNLMDAISFAMGETPQNLRAKKLTDLIHGATVNHPMSKTATVTAIFEMGQNEYARFSRSVVNGSSVYEINCQTVPLQTYLQELQKLGINIKAKNFLVFQGTVESIALRNPKQVSLLFEEMSSSITLKTEYEKLENELQKAESLFTSINYRSKALREEKKKAKEEAGKAKDFEKLSKALSLKKQTLALFQLFYFEKEIEHNDLEFRAKCQEADSVRQSKLKAEKVLADKKAEFSELRQDISEMDQRIRAVESELSKKQLVLLKVQEKLTHKRKKSEAAQKSLEQAVAAKNNYHHDVLQLTNNLSEVSKLLEEYEAEGEELNDEILREYRKLKEKALKESGDMIQEIDIFNHEQRIDLNNLENEERLLKETTSLLNRRKRDLEQFKEKSMKLAQLTQSLKQELDEKKKSKDNFAVNMENTKRKCDECRIELMEVVRTIGDARIDTQLSVRETKKQQVLETLRKQFAGVFSRVVDCIAPIHARYNVALTKVIGHEMDAIVVNTESTARQCVEFLASNKHEPETFLPLNFIKAPKLKERLRELQEPVSTRLLYDVVQCKQDGFDKLARYLTGNVLVCETNEEAAFVAYRHPSGQRYSAISLKGRYFQANGVISGCSGEIVQKAQRWNREELKDLQSKRETLEQRYRETLKEVQRGNDINNITVQIRGISSRLVHADNELMSANETVDNLAIEIEKLEETSRKTSAAIGDLRHQMNEREESMKTKKRLMEEKEDEVFHEFCQHVGVGNVREFEHRELRAREVKRKRRSEIENQRNLIEQQLEFQRSRIVQIEANVERWDRALIGDVEEIKTLANEERTLSEQVEEELGALNELKAQRNVIKANLEDSEEQIAGARRDVKRETEHLERLLKAKNVIEALIYQKKYEKHTVLVRVKVEGIKIPMNCGSMDDIDDTISEIDFVSQATSQSDSESTQENSETIYRREERIVIDYSNLADDLKQFSDLSAAKRQADLLKDAVHDLNEQISKLKQPNMKAAEKKADAAWKLREINAELQEALDNVKDLKERFNQVKAERQRLFKECFQHVCDNIDSVYKNLAGNNSAQACLFAETDDEPYLKGLRFECLASGKRYMPMDQLSGGEKTIAALALLFAILSYRPAPFCVLDEIDAALDATNVDRVARFIQQKRIEMQMIVISHKKSFFKYADLLVGVHPDPDEENLSTGVLLVDLLEYRAECLPSSSY